MLPTGSDPRPIISLVEVGRRTTDPALAVANLEAWIEGVDEAVALVGDESAARTLLFDALVLRTQFLGSYSDFATMDSLTSLESGATSATEHYLRGRFLVSVHDFTSAHVELERAEQMGGDVSELRQTLRLALHQDLSLGLAEAERRAEKRGSMGNLLQLAAFQAAEGRFEDADASFVRAAAAYRDVSPFPLAYIAFQRGVMWSESAGQKEWGRACYREALRVLPNYVVAHVHLGEILLDSDPDEARHHYEQAMRSQDPEPLGKLASYHLSSNPKLAAIYRRRAEDGYNRLLLHYPLAFADHAAEFFAGPGGDAERAVDLALLNLSNRKNPRAYLVALGAAEAAEDLSLLCSLSKEARPLGGVHPALARELERISPACLWVEP